MKELIRYNCILGNITLLSIAIIGYELVKLQQKEKSQNLLSNGEKR